MYQHTNVKFYEAQLHPSPKERDSPPRPRRAPSAPITSWPEPAAATAALQRPVPSPDPQNTPLPPLKRTPRISAGVGGARGHGREEAANPPRCDTRFPAHPGPHAASPPSLPPARPDGARRRFPARPGGELRSPAPKDEPPAGGDLAGAGGGGRWPGRGQGGGEPPPHPAVTGEEMRENPRCSRRRRERRVTGERRRTGTMRKQKMQVKRRLPRDPEGPAAGAGSGGPEGAAPGRTTTPAAPRDNEGTRGRGGGQAAAGLPRRSPPPTKPRGRLGPGPAPAPSRPSPRSAGPAMMPANRAGPGQPGPGLRGHGGALPPRAPRQRGAPSGARSYGPRREPPACPAAHPGVPSPPPGTAGSRPLSRAYLAGPFPGPLRGTRPGSAPRRVPGSQRQRALGRGGGPSPAAAAAFPRAGRKRHWAHGDPLRRRQGRPGHAHPVLRWLPRRRAPPRQGALLRHRPSRPPSLLAVRPRGSAHAAASLVAACRPRRSSHGRGAPLACGAARQARGGRWGAAAAGADAGRGVRAAAAPGGRAALRAEGRGVSAARGATPASGHVAERRGGAGGGREGWGGGRRAHARCRRARGLPRGTSARGGRGSRRGVPGAPPGAATETRPARAGAAGPAHPQPAGPLPRSPEQRPRGP
ncbi:PREDICTED: collagen alpha-1(I) chain-like [Lepidothrix coronata]|uniref:Collagen alpha-1(I) chain-like n=1 Tax=Lepidothrix coronata TaxID=321398 RepID=A0A6J0HQY1_9PASS|nr:PREDICTED: collagen alpha-1(I) chain-like [Lepidothrix coronata]